MKVVVLVAGISGDTAAAFLKKKLGKSCGHKALILHLSI